MYSFNFHLNIDVLSVKSLPGNGERGQNGDRGGTPHALIGTDVLPHHSATNACGGRPQSDVCGGNGGIAAVGCERYGCHLDQIDWADMTCGHPGLGGAPADDHCGGRAQSDSGCGHGFWQDLSIALPSRALSRWTGKNILWGFGVRFHCLHWLSYHLDVNRQHFALYCSHWAGRQQLPASLYLQGMKVFQKVLSGLQNMYCICDRLGYSGISCVVIEV